MADGKMYTERIKIAFYCMVFPILFCIIGCGEEKQTDKEAEAAEIRDTQEEWEMSGKIETEERYEEAEWSGNLFEDYRAALYDNDRIRDEVYILSESGWEQRQGRYYEYMTESDIGQSVYMESEQRTEGFLAAETERGKVTAMHIALYDGYEWMEYEYYDSGDILYFSCYGPETGNNLPGYWVCTYSLIGLGRPDGWTEEDIRRLKGLEESGTGYVRKEYFMAGGHIYAIDREVEMLLDVTSTPIRYAVEWLEGVAGRVFLQNKISPEAVESVRRLASPPYAWSDRFSQLAVCDLNKDGVDDYVAVLVDPESVQTVGKWISKDEVICLYLSDAECGYREKILLGKDLTDTLDLHFESDGLLACMNKIYRGPNEPFTKAYFRFDGETEEFLFMGEAEQYWRCYLHIRGREEGEYTLEEYYRSRQNWLPYYRQQSWHKEDVCRVETTDGQELLVYYDRVLANPDLKDTDNVSKELVRYAEIFAEDAILSHANPVSELADGNFGSRDTRQGREENKVVVNISYQNPQIICGRVDGNDESGEYWYTDFAVDRENGEFIYVQDLIGRDEMLCILRKGMEDGIGGEEAERYLEWIEEGYENANSVLPKSSYGKWGFNINFCIDEWGVFIIFKVKTDKQGGIVVESVYLDKEYFMDTPLWKYWEAAFPWAAEE